MAVPEHHIREALARYVSGEIPLPVFQEWFVPRAWEVLAEGGAAIDLTSDIELLLAEYTGGHRTEHDLQDALKQHAAVPAAGFVYLREDVTEHLTWSHPWVQSVAGAIYRWQTSVAGADFGNSTVDLRAAQVVESPRIQVSEVEQAA